MNATLRIACLTAFLLAVGIAAQAADSRPNVLFIVCDDLNTHVSTSDYEYTSTPSFDALAAEGMTFKRAYCQYPVCGPSRASFLHGLYPQSTGVLNNTTDIQDLRAGTVSLPRRLRENGYWTASTGKIFHGAQLVDDGVSWDVVTRFSNDELPLVTKAREKFEAEHGSIEQGPARKIWREYLPTIATQTRGQHVGYGPTGLTDEQHMDGKNARQTAAWIKNKDFGDKPFFIACGIQKPHVPFLAPDKYFEMYPRAGLVFSPAPKDFWKQAPLTAMDRRFEGFGFELGVENDPLRREYMQAYHACISFIDAQIGLVLDTLKETGHWDDTVVILTSDHGYQLGEHFMWGKVTLFEICDRVPFVVRVPGKTTAGSTSQGLVELIDVYPTVAELCDVEAPRDLQGKSLVPMFADPNATVNDVAYTVVSRGQNLGKAIRTARYRYAIWPDGEELYDLDNDLVEHHNLSSSPDYADVLADMRKLLAETDQRAASARELVPGDK